MDLAKGTYKNTIGTVELKAVWTDPEFDQTLNAFYYARVLEIPTPRWSTIQAAKLGRVPPSGPGFQPTIQERAWTTPIWYTPDEETRKASKPGVTVTDLRQKGAIALDDAQLKELVVGKTVNVINTITGDRYEILYGADGMRLVTYVNGRSTDLSDMAEISHGPGETQYEIRDGLLITHLLGTTFEVTVYNLGKKYIAARSNEFGYANYEVEVKNQ